MRPDHRSDWLADHSKVPGAKGQRERPADLARTFPVTSSGLASDLILWRPQPLEISRHGHWEGPGTGRSFAFVFDLDIPNTTTSMGLT